MIQNIRKNEFESLIKSSKPVLADFYAEWCSPCRMLSPVIEEIGDKYKAYFETVKVNVDEIPIDRTLRCIGNSCTFAL